MIEGVKCLEMHYYHLQSQKKSKAKQVLNKERKSEKVRTSNTQRGNVFGVSRTPLLKRISAAELDELDSAGLEHAMDRLERWKGDPGRSGGDPP